MIQCFEIFRSSGKADDIGIDGNSGVQYRCHWEIIFDTRPAKNIYNRSLMRFIICKVLHIYMRCKSIMYLDRFLCHAGENTGRSVSLNSMPIAIPEREWNAIRRVYQGKDYFQTFFTSVFSMRWSWDVRIWNWNFSYWTAKWTIYIQTTSMKFKSCGEVFSNYFQFQHQWKICFLDVNSKCFSQKFRSN